MITIELPCQIGDYAYAIRNHKGRRHAHRGVVSEMYFLDGMRLVVALKGICRGEWGQTIFGTEEEVNAVIRERYNQ